MTQNCQTDSMQMTSQSKSCRLIDALSMVVVVQHLEFPGATLSFVISLVFKNFDVLPNILIEPFFVKTR